MTDQSTSVATSSTSKSNKISQFLKPTPAPTATPGSNSLTEVKSKFQSIVASKQLIKSEQEHISDIIKILKDNHQIEPKIARKVADMLYKGNQDEVDAEQAAIDDLFTRVK